MCQGGMLGPILFGYALDHSCLLWEQKCDGSTGSCLYYDNHQMAWLSFAVCAACKALNVLCGLITWRMYMYKLRKGSLPQPTVEQTQTVAETGNGATGNSYESTDNTAPEGHGDQAFNFSNPESKEESTQI